MVNSNTLFDITYKHPAFTPHFSDLVTGASLSASFQDSPAIATEIEEEKQRVELFRALYKDDWLKALNAERSDSEAELSYKKEDDDITMQKERDAVSEQSRLLVANQGRSRPPLTKSPRSQSPLAKSKGSVSTTVDPKKGMYAFTPIDCRKIR